MKQRQGKTARAQNARFASATTCSFGINPRSSLRLAFWDSPEPSHRDFSSLSDPPALTAPHCVQRKKTFSWPCNRASSDVYDTRKFLIGARCLAPQNGLCGFVTDFRLCHKFTFRFTLNSLERLGLAPARLTVPFPSADVRSS